MRNGGTCVRVSNIPFAKEKTERGKWVSRLNKETGKYELIRIPDRVVSSDVHGVNQDSMEPVQSMVDGKWYDSKSALRRHYREAGYAEVGNDLLGYRGTPECQMESWDDSIRETMRAYESPSWVENERQRRERMRQH